ncbi:MAG: YbaB/EbfC family nucleoid-associated protein [bacterium]|nr:YbaB/EbfC family nucleoid-associated protein [bacterium]
MSMDSLLEQAQAMREKQQRELSETLSEGHAADGAVAAKMDGHKHLRSIRIDPGVIDAEDLGALEKHVMDAVNEATDEMESILVRRFGPSSGIPDLL